MILAMFAVFALAEPTPEYVTCLTHEDFEARVLAPLIELRKCQQEREVFDRAADRLAATAKNLQDERDDARRQTKKAKRNQPKWAGAGAGGALLLVLLVLLM